MDDILDKFFEYYVRGDLISAVGQILPAPDFPYDNLKAKDEDLLPQIVNFVDASVFGTLPEVKLENFVVREFITKQAQTFKFYREALDILSLEYQFLAFILGEAPKEKIPAFFQTMLGVEKGKELLGSSEIEHILHDVPESMRMLIQFHLMMAWGWQKISNAKPFLSNNFAKGYLNLHPWYPIQYSFPVPSIDKASLINQIPVIFFEPIKHDLAPFLQQLKGRHAIFALGTMASFFQMLQFPAFVDSLCDPEHFVYILELYPNQQFAAQDLGPFGTKELFPVFFAPIKTMKDYVPVLLQALKACLTTPKNALNIDTPEGNWAYEVSKRLLLSIQQERLGLYRAPALHMRLGQQKWYDSHKGVVPSDRPLGPEVKDQMHILLSKLARKRTVRAKIDKEKFSLAHIVPQIIYGGHAPTRLLENLVFNHDPKKFDVTVVSTELLKNMLLEYPFNFYTSEPSEKRGWPTMYQFQKIGVETILNKKCHYYITDAFDLTRLLKERKIDIAVFHGPDVVNSMAAQMVDVPLRVLFEHGSQAVYPGFDLAIVSSIAAVDLYQDLYKKIGTRAVALPFALDVRKGWLPQPFTRESLGLPEDAVVMTTISTKLDARLTDELCHVIAEILKRAPKAFYAPIGQINNVDRIKKIFAEYGVEDRFHPLGMALHPPSQYARSMHLYLNEFPFGGCLAILDAMAAGCPVVTMYDATGPQQARYGGNFIGIDRAVTSGKKEQYIDLACRLLTDPAMYKEWSRHAIQQYEKFADVKSYVTSFENIILEAYGC